jgi:hypothetical protein
VLRGIDEWLRFREQAPWGGLVHFEPERFYDLDVERVLVLLRVSATGQASGARVEARAAHELTIRNGQLCALRCTLTATRPSALPAWRCSRALRLQSLCNGHAETRARRRDASHECNSRHAPGPVAPGHEAGS